MAAPVSSSSGSRSSLPREALVVQAILKDMGVTEYDPAVVNQLLDFSYRYTTDILDDAKLYSNYAGKKIIDVDDTKLAVQLKLDKSYTNPPPRELLLDIASHKNTQTLPLIKPFTGPKLPPDRYCLTAMNYQLRSARKPNPITFTTAGLNIRQPQRASLLTNQVTPISLVNRAAAPARTMLSVRPPTVQTVIQPTVQTGQQPIIQTVPVTSQATIVTAPVKRKLEEDDYDN